MTIRTTAKTTALAALFAIGAALPAAADDDYRCTPGAAALSVPQVSERLAQQGYRDITRVESDDGCYKVRATDASGRRVRLIVDPATGTIAERRERR